jgi:hypothetical protein
MPMNYIELEKMWLRYVHTPLLNLTVVYKSKNIFFELKHYSIHET